MNTFRFKTDEKQCFFMQSIINLENSVLHDINKVKCLAVSKVNLFSLSMKSLFSAYAATGTTPKLQI